MDSGKLLVLVFALLFVCSPVKSIILSLRTVTIGLSGDVHMMKQTIVQEEANPCIFCFFKKKQPILGGYNEGCTCLGRRSDLRVTTKFAFFAKNIYCLGKSWGDLAREG
jgi:hypothetical protein